MARTGRRRGRPDTRETILAAALDVFGERGFDGASIRAIAAAAGVDPALVHHYFGTKEKLFLATVQAPIDPDEILPRVLPGDVNGLGERIVRTFLSVWDDPVQGSAALALFRTAIRHDWSARMLREFLTTQILRKAIAQVPMDPDEAPMRATLVASQIFGLVGIRYLLKVEPLSKASADEVAAMVGPTL